jgi:RNA polymerase sigma-70 factor (ECF subfamily)
VLSRPESFEDGIVKAMPALNKFAISLTRGGRIAAEDLVQDTMMRALQHKAKFVPGTNLDAWLFTILRNSYYSTARKRQREVEDPDEQIAKHVPIEDSPLRKLTEFLQLVQKLPSSFRDTLLLLADGATYEEVALEIVEQVGTVKSRANRGRALLKAADGQS